MEQKLLAYFKEHESEIFADLKKLVLAEASTADVEALARCRQVLAGLIRERTGIEPVLHGETGEHPQLTVTFGQGDEKVLLLGHYDTVCPIGSMEYRIEGNELHGPGVLDMKSGVISAIWTVKACQDLGIDPGKRIVLLFNGDEETGSVESEALIRSESKDSKAVLVCEPCDSEGNLKTGRKGVSSYQVTIRGRAAHAGNNHQLGINALEEMAREIQYIHSLTDYAAGTTLNVGVCKGGTKRNVVPDYAYYEIDHRYKTKAEWTRIKELLLALKPMLPGAECKVEFVAGRPPMEETEGNLKLFALARESGEKLGLHFTHKFVGGGSDGNLASDMGVPVLDGMGAVGDGLHASREHLLMDQYIPRIALLASVVLKI